MTRERTFLFFVPLGGVNLVYAATPPFWFVVLLSVLVYVSVSACAKRRGDALYPSFFVLFSWECICIYVLHGEAMLCIQAGCQENMTIAQTLAMQLLVNLPVRYYSKHEICG